MPETQVAVLICAWCDEPIENKDGSIKDNPVSRICQECFDEVSKPLPLNNENEMKLNHHYHINGDNKCPRCEAGTIIRDLNDAVCLNCGLRESKHSGLISHLEEQIIQWLIRNLPRQMFSTRDYLDQNKFKDNTKYFRIPSPNGVINFEVETLLLKFADLEQLGVLSIHHDGIISDYDDVIIVYDVLDKDKIDKRLVPVGVL
ncbi:hypothetical protein LCGC14_0884420 [marine sediment metagenome]|uniref:Uncharacterized protein n=1 Tax=marine sediment metagenome TaxID=412755 RepID=A0A0F9PLM2_9ZZZZ